MKPRGVATNGPSNIESDFKLQVRCGKGSYGLVQEPCSVSLYNDPAYAGEDLSGDYHRLISVDWVRNVFNPSYRKFCEDRCINYDIKDFIYGKRKSLTS